MNDQPLNYAQITAATRQVIQREAERCQRELKMDRKYAHIEAHRNIAYGSLALWSELTLFNKTEDDRLQLNWMVDAIGKLEGQR